MFLRTKKVVALSAASLTTMLLLTSCGNGASYETADANGEELSRAKVQEIEGIVDDFYEKRSQVEEYGDQVSRELVDMACRGAIDDFQPSKEDFGRLSTYEYSIKKIQHTGKISTGDTWKVFYDLTLTKKESGEKDVRNASYMSLRYNDSLELCISKINEKSS